MLFTCRRLFFLCALSLCSLPLFAQTPIPTPRLIPTPAPELTARGMTQLKMAEIIAQVAGQYQGAKNNIQFVFNEVPMALISDARNNRMRIIAPITEVENLTPAHLKAAMVSNFHLALDARYAIAKGVLYATYIHPLKELTKQQLESAVSQVSTLRLTFGSTYTSGALTFGGENSSEEDI